MPATIDSVASDLLGVASWAMIEALIADERYPALLAAPAPVALRPKPEELGEA